MTDHPPLDPLEIFLLGEIEFSDAQRLQRKLVYDLGERSGGALILCEHPPTITVGRSGSRAHIRPDDEELREAKIRLQWVNRGGGCLFHLPGQLAAYFLLPLEARGLSLQQYVDGLHEVLIAVLAEFDLKAHRRPDLSGVFLGNSRVGTVAIAVNRWIASHGITLNVGPYLSPFELLDEPGFGGWPLRQTSMEAQRQRPAPMAKVRESLIRCLESRFGLEQHHIYTEHPLLRPKARPHAYVASLG